MAVAHSAIPIFTNGTLISVKVKVDVKDSARTAALSPQAWTKKVEVVHCLLVDICCIFLQIIAEHVNIDKGTAPLVIEQTVGKRNLCARFVLQEWIVSC